MRRASLGLMLLGLLAGSCAGDTGGQTVRFPVAAAHVPTTCLGLWNGSWRPTS